MNKIFELALALVLSSAVLSGCGGNTNGGGKGSPVYLPYDIDETGTICRFYGNNDNSVNIDVPNTYSFDAQGRIISGDTYQVISIGDYCFANNILTETINIPNNVISIGKNAFYNCPNLRKINISSSISSIGDNAFERCDKLTKIASSGNEGIIASTNHNLKEFVIPSTITELGDFVFNRWSELSSIHIDEPIKKIGNESICNNPKLAVVTINTQLDSLGNNVFKDCPLLKTIGNKKSSSGVNFLTTQNITKFVIPSSFTTIESKTFYGWDKLQEITLPKSIESVEDVFDGNYSLKNITCSLKMILNMFSYVSGTSELKKDDAMYTVSTGGYYSSNYSYFIPKTLVEIHILDVTDLNSKCFYYMTSLERVFLDSTITSFGYGAFAGCTGLTVVYLKADCDWEYSNNSYDSGIVSKSRVNDPRGFASEIKKHNGLDYRWYASK